MKTLPGRNRDSLAVPREVEFVRQDGGTNVDIQSRLSKARNAFRSLNAVWRSSQCSIKIKLKLLYQSCVLPTLLYESECWLMTEHDDFAKLSSFHTTSRRKIQRIFWAKNHLQP